MTKKLLCAAGLFCMLLSQAQECPDLLSPSPGSTDVPVTTAISWQPVEGVPGYILSLGTTPGDSDILNAQVGGATRYTPPLGLPENTQIFVTITLFFFNQPDIVCDSFSFTTEDVVTPPPCTTLQSPANGALDVPVGTEIRWAYSPTATEYAVNIGTSPGGSDLGSGTQFTTALSYTPPDDLPAEQDIYVTIIPFNENGMAIGCSEERFTTGALAALPGCTLMTDPANGATDVPLSPRIEWSPVPGAEGYRVYIGTSPQENDILDGSSILTNRTGVINFEPNSIYYIRIVPFNEAGEAFGCVQESFSTILGCGPYFEPDGSLVDRYPVNTFPERVGICQDQPVNTVSATDEAAGYRWYRVEGPDRERLLATGPDFDIPGEGTYRHEIYNTYTGASGEFECSATREFEAVASEGPVITGTDVQLGSGTLRIEVAVSGGGDYEYALGEPDGTYQQSAVFEGLSPGAYRIFVRDKNGCGRTDVLVQPDLNAAGFPNFFTPNGDGQNDRWQFIPPDGGGMAMQEISIFDRYGNLLARVEPGSEGWDGTIDGQPLPSSDYWFRAIDTQGGVLTGHFVLKR